MTHWTRTRPMVPGWYWWRAAKDAPAGLVLLKDNGLCQLHGVGYFVQHESGEWSSEAIEMPKEAP